MSKGTDLITAERKRQITKEGWTPAHDVAEHDDGALAVAAACYAVAGLPGNAVIDWGKRGDVLTSGDGSVLYLGVDAWPWDEDASSDKRKQHDRLRRLTIAGALIAAEIDRLLQAGEEQL